MLNCLQQEAILLEDRSLRKNMIVSHVASSKYKNNKETVFLLRRQKRRILLMVYSETVHYIKGSLMLQCNRH